MQHTGRYGIPSNVIDLRCRIAICQ
jgi:hypothetical protein